MESPSNSSWPGVVGVVLALVIAAAVKQRWARDNRSSPTHRAWIDFESCVDTCLGTTTWR